MNSELSVVQVNYWKELRKEIKETIGSLHGLILLTHNSADFSDIVDFLNIVRRDEQLTILYISLIQSYSRIREVLQNKPLVSKKLTVVDCVSGFLIELQDTFDCVYRRPPENLEAMKDLILKSIERVNPNIIVVDSLSQFINFSMPSDTELSNLYKFLRLIKEHAMGIINDTVILLYDDRAGYMRKLPTMFTNLILKMEVIREKPEWRE